MKCEQLFLLGLHKFMQFIFIKTRDLPYRPWLWEIHRYSKHGCYGNQFYAIFDLNFGFGLLVINLYFFSVVPHSLTSHCIKGLRLRVWIFILRSKANLWSTGVYVFLHEGPLIIEWFLHITGFIRVLEERTEFLASLLSRIWSIKNVKL